MRIWNRQETDAGQEVLLSEQWFEPGGGAIGATAPVQNSPDGVGWLDPVRTLRLDEIEVIREGSPEQDYGYPEAQLPTSVEEMAAALANDPESTPAAFMSISTYGPDGSYLPSGATASVRNLTRLLPTIMDPTARRLAFDAASSLEGAAVGSGEDILSRRSMIVSVPLSITDPTTGSGLGQLDVKFWFDPDSYAVLQIEWRLTEGTLGVSGNSQFVDTTVIVTAGHVAAIPQIAPTTAVAPNTPTTTTPPIPDGD